MAFTFTSPPDISTDSSGSIRSSYNYISQYDYATQFEPDKVLQLHPRYGNGLITGFCKIVGAEMPYNSDVVLHAELDRLMNVLFAVTNVTDTFTTAGAEDHNLRVGDAVFLSDGTNEEQGVVTGITSDSIFVCANRETGAFANSTWTVSTFSSEFGKGTAGFTQGFQQDPIFYKNYSHTIKEYYEVAESDMAHATWLKTPYGEDKWYALELERTRMKFQNKMELTHLFSKRAVATSDADTAGYAGMNGIVPTIESRGNLGSAYVETLAELDEITKRIRRQGDCTSYTAWCDQDQRIKFSNLLGAVNQYSTTGANYGIFNNSKELAVHLDFEGTTRNGISFFLTDWKVLNDPTLMGATNFLSTNVACLLVPAGEKQVSDETGLNYASPYISIRYRIQGDVNRYMRTKIFGLPGTEIREDKMEIQYISEQTNQVVGANEFVLVKRG